MIDNLKNPRQNTLKTTVSSFQNTSQYYDMIVFCHLRWQFVYQRPQHIISRMAKTMKTLFIEEPLYDSQNKNSGNLIVVDNMLHILQPNVKDIESIAGIIPNYVKGNTIQIGWFYSSSFSSLLPQLNFETVVYDCMDELCLFKDATPHLINQEKFLIAHTDIIFTGEKSLYESKKELHPTVHCFPSSIDQAHFAKALNGITISDDIAHLQSPIVGYHGVIDERIDLKLLHEVAQRLPNVSFVMIGPLAKIEESDLPRASNIHYLGMKSYDELPHYLKAFDIAMMPFALNDATKYISPTKTLEYMAAGRPIISTNIVDVVRDYSNCVSLVEKADEFCQAVTFLLNKTDYLPMQIEYHKILQKTSWETTVYAMKSIIKTYVK